MSSFNFRELTPCVHLASFFKIKDKASGAVNVKV
jgi:hypothetical protein